MDEEVVHTHRDEVDADGVVAAREERDAELRAHAVRGGGEHRVPVAPGDAEEAGEGPDVPQDLRAVRPPGERREAPHGQVARPDVDPRRPVGQPPPASTPDHRARGPRGTYAAAH